jgi:triosephosphate isomerase (TIM)
MDNRMGGKTGGQLIAGNWKMNGLRADLDQLLALEAALEAKPARGTVALCLPATLVALAHDLGPRSVLIGAQTVDARHAGAHTGDLNAEMLKNAGARLVIVGHSERRADHGETDGSVRAKAAAAEAVGLVPIVCVGESLAEREAGEASRKVRRQVAGSLDAALIRAGAVVAYEPIWAIGTGRTASLEDIENMHAEIRAELIAMAGPEAGEATRILYGGSVKPDNARGILATANVGGALVGGASLKADDFLVIVDAIADIG